MAKILLAEDEVNIASFIERGLKEFGHSVTVCHNGNTGWKVLQEEPFDLIILDIIMPKINGLELCHLYRQRFGYQTPVIMLTALGTTEDIVKGLDAGADDYLVKPFSFQELEARIKALLRRNKETAANQLTCDNLVLDCNIRRAKRGDVDIDLTVKEYRLLEYFMTHQGVALSRITLLKDVWDKNFDTLLSVLTTIIIIAVFYLFSTQFINKLYASYLREKAYLTAQKHWEKDEVDEQSYQIIQRKYDELLPEAHEILLNMDSLSEVRDTLNKYLTQHQQALLIAGEDSIPFSFKYKDQLGAALYYPDNEGNFIVLVMSRNVYGAEIKEHLLLLSIFLVLFSSILIYLVGKIYSGRILVPLQHILKELKRIRANSLNRRLRTTGNNDELEDMIKTLNSMLDRLDSAFKAEKSFVSHASHELNNPITAIQGECEISLLKERSTGEYMEALQRISSESKRLSNLIRHLLFLSRQDEELLKSNIEELSLPDMLKGLTGTNERIRLHDGEMNKAATVKANPYLLKIALKNIIDNACKYSEKEVDITLRQEDRHLVLEVKDQGIGIPPEEIEHIFQSFYRGSNTHDYAGQGIGLSLTQKIISAYNARLEISSEIEKGTKVRVIF